MANVCIIPARGGSKRIPGKNIKDFLGQPIIAYSIQAALESKLFDEVMVSTDDNEIAAVAKKYGAQVPFMRSAKNADDYASTVDVLLEVIADYRQQGQVFEIGCCIYATAPFVSTALLQRAYDKLSTSGYDTVFPLLPFSFPIQRAVNINEEARVQMFQPEHLTTRSQDLEKAYHDAGQFYWFKVDTLQQEQKLWTNNTGAILLNELQAHDIDNEEDWEIAEFKFKLAKHG